MRLIFLSGERLENEVPVAEKPVSLFATAATAFFVVLVYPHIYIIVQ